MFSISYTTSSITRCNVCSERGCYFKVSKSINNMIFPIIIMYSNSILINALGSETSGTASCISPFQDFCLDSSLHDADIITDVNNNNTWAILYFRLGSGETGNGQRREELNKIYINAGFPVIKYTNNTFSECIWKTWINPECEYGYVLMFYGKVIPNNGNITRIYENYYKKLSADREKVRRNVAYTVLLVFCGFFVLFTAVGLLVMC